MSPARGGGGVQGMPLDAVLYPCPTCDLDGSTGRGSKPVWFGVRNPDLFRLPEKNQEVPLPYLSYVYMSILILSVQPVKCRTPPPHSLTLFISGGPSNQVAAEDILDISRIRQKNHCMLSYHLTLASLQLLL